MSDIWREDEKTPKSPDNAPEESSLEGFILLPPIGAFFAFLFYLFAQIRGWIKTAEWQTITLHKSLIDIKVINPNFYFDLPNALGIQKILNGLLSSSAAVFYYCLSVILLFVCASIVDDISKLKENNQKYNKDEILQMWTEESKELQKKSKGKKKVPISHD